MYTNKILVPLTILALVITACGDDDDDADAAATESTESAEQSITTTSAPEEAAGPVEIVAVDYAFEGVPDQIEAGTVLSLRNDSDAEIHELVAFGLPRDEERSVEEILALPEDELGSILRAEPATVLIAPPGESSFPAVGDGSLTQPGRYLLFCSIPTGADPAEFLRAAQEAQEGGPPDVAGGPPHFTAGMFGELVVE